MNERETILAIGKSLQALHSRLTTGTPQKWNALSSEDQGTWLRIARRARNKFEALQAVQSQSVPIRASEGRASEGQASDRQPDAPSGPTHVPGPRRIA
jgi:hypothetical protein